MYSAGFEVYDISPQRAMDVSQRSRTCLDFMMSWGRATSITAEKASRSLLKSGVAVAVAVAVAVGGRGGGGSVLETVEVGPAAAVAEVEPAAVVEVVATGRTELIRASEAVVATTGAAIVTVDNDDAAAADSPSGSSDADVDVDVDVDVAVVDADADADADVDDAADNVDDVTEEGALNLQNPAAFALATRMFLSCFSVYGWKPRVVQARDLRGTSTTVAIILILGCDSCHGLSCIEFVMFC
jgi:hypothetical protein